VTVLVDSTRALTAETHHRLAGTRRLIERNRRHLNPWWSLSDSSDAPNVRHIVIERLSRRSLPPAPAKLWAGNGTGQICIVCNQMIIPTPTRPTTPSRQCTEDWLVTGTRCLRELDLFIAAQCGSANRPFDMV